MKKLLLVSILFMSINLIGQTKLELINGKLLKTAEVEMKKIVTELDMKDIEITGDCSTTTKNCVLFIEDVNVLDNGVMIVSGYYSCEATSYCSGNIFSGQMSRLFEVLFEAKVKPLLDDFVVTDFVSHVVPEVRPTE